MDDFCASWSNAVQVSCLHFMLPSTCTLSWRVAIASHNVRSHLHALSDLFPRELVQRDASGKPVSLVTNDNPVWQAIRCVSSCDIVYGAAHAHTEPVSQCV